MEEQSHKSEMRAALQGDFERLRARRQTGVSEVAGEQAEPDGQPAELPVTAAAVAPAPHPWLDRLRRRR